MDRKVDRELADEMLAGLRKALGPVLGPSLDRLESQLAVKRGHEDRLDSDPGYRAACQAAVDAKNQEIRARLERRIAAEARAVVGKEINLVLEKATRSRSGSSVHGVITAAEPEILRQGRRLYARLRVQINGRGPFYPVNRWPR